MDFDKWFETFVPKETEYYVIYNPKTSVVNGVYPDHAAVDVKHKLKIDTETAEKIFNGKIPLTSCFVDVIDDKLELIQITSLVKISDVLHRIPDNKYSPIENPDILIQFLSEQKSFNIQLSNKIKKKRIRWTGDTELKFMICAYNDPHKIYQLIDLTLEKLFVDDVEIPYAGTDTRFSIFTAKVFKKYVFEKI